MMNKQLPHIPHSAEKGNHRLLKAMMGYLSGVLLLTILLSLSACSTKKNTAGSRFYHSFTTRFNVYFNGNEAYKQGLKAIEQGNKDVYTEILPLYPIGNKKTIGMGSGDFDRTIEKSQKAIKLHSIKKKPTRKPGKSRDPKYKRWLQQKEYNPFMHHAWMMMGNAQFHKGEFLEAASTFAYIARLYETNPEIEAKARIQMANCYTQLAWFYDAEDALAKVNNDSLANNLIPGYAAAYGNYLLGQQRFKEAIPYLLTTIRNEKSKKQRARAYFLLGQLYQQVDERQKAYNAYGKVITQAPPYELELSARMKQTEVITTANIDRTINKLRRMAKSDKNKEYLDQVYYALGNVFLAKQDTVQALKEYHLGAEKSTRGGIEKGIILLTLGDIYWQKTRYADAQKCYAEAIGLIDKEYPTYELASKRSEVLDDLVAQMEVVETQDSLQHLASLTEAERMKVIEQIIESVKKKEETEKEEALHEELMAKREDAIGENEERPGNRPSTPTVSTGDKSWYFYNPQLVSQGKSDFQRKWGRRKLEDNWRRRNKVVYDTQEFTQTDYNEETAPTEATTKGDATDSLQVDSVSTDTKNPQFYLNQIPLTEKAMEESNSLLSEALYNLAMIYKDQLEDFPQAQQTFTQLYTKFPLFGQQDEVYYQLYLMNARWKRMTEAEQYKQKLITGYPQSKYGIALADPDYIYNLIHGKRLEDSLYVDTYTAYQRGDFGKVKSNTTLSAAKYAMGYHRAKFLFLNAMSLLQSGERKQFMEALKEVVEKYPKNEISELAANMVKGLQDGRLLASDGSSLGSIWKRRKSDMGADSTAADSLLPRFTAETGGTHLFVLAYEEGKINENLLLYEMARYNFTAFMVKNFDITFEKDNGIAGLLVKEFTNFEEVSIYQRMLYADKEMATKLSGMRAVIISAANYELLKKYYSYDDYQLFFDTHLSPLIPIKEEVKGYDEKLAPFIGEEQDNEINPEQ